MKRFCVGCGACVGVCPSNAILPTVDHGVATISVNHKECSDCDLCRRVCPIFDYLSNLSIFAPINKASLELFTGYACDKQARYNAASGGLVTALTSYLLEKGEINGVLTVRMQGKEPLPFIATDPNELKGSQGSIYFPTFGLKATRLLKKTEGRWVIVGLPCQINAIKKSIGRNLLRKDSIEYLFGLRCYHTNSPWYLDYIVNRMLRISKNKINEISSRKHGWPGCIAVKSESGNYFVPEFFNRRLGVGLWNPMALEHINAQLGCLICNDRDSLNADITFADAWFKAIMNNDKIGTSLIIARTEKGLELIKKAASEGKIVINNAKEENLPKLIERRASAYEAQHRIVSDIAKNGFAKNAQKHGVISILAALPHMIFHSPSFRQVLLNTIPPKILMDAISVYTRTLNTYFFNQMNG